jgi:hypothetical protein
MTSHVEVCDTTHLTRSFAARVYDGGDPAPLLRWRDAWRYGGGAGQCIGLLDSTVPMRVHDLAAASIQVREFTHERRADRRAFEHGTHSATLLVGQGSRWVRGIAPRARLLIASVAGAGGGVAPGVACANGLRWLVARGARVIVIALGESAERHELAQAIDDATAAGAIVFAAAGTGHAGAAACPACHPATIAVGAADRIGRLLAECSCTQRLDLIAPGHSVRALFRDGVLRRRRGMDVACVVAAGVAALAISAGAVAGAVTRSSVLATLRRGGWPPDRVTTTLGSPSTVPSTVPPSSIAYEHSSPHR